MTIQCVYCKVTWRGKPGMYGGRSKVVETRIVASRRLEPVRAKEGFVSKRRATRTVRRVRECLTCRFRWKTIEVPLR